LAALRRRAGPRVDRTIDAAACGRLLLDEPTNDLDIPTLEILEESLLEYSGALVLVTHDRFMLDRVSTVVLGLDGLGSAERFADYSQWRPATIADLQGHFQRAAGNRGPRATAVEGPPAVTKKKLSYSESREFDNIESRIAEAESELHAKRGVLDDPAITSDRVSLQNACVQLEEPRNWWIASTRAGLNSNRSRGEVPRQLPNAGRPHLR